MAQLFKNNAYSSLAAGLAISGTTLTVASGHGDRFPVVSGGDFCLLTLQNASNNIEIVKVTARAAGADSMTVVRAQEGTTERNWLLGDVVDLRITASYLGFLGFLAGAPAATAAGFRALLDVPTRAGGDASGTWGISISGNAATVTNGVYTSGAYANPGWITALAASKITGQLAVGNGGTGAATFTAGSLLVGNGTGAVGTATAAQVVAAIGSTAVQNANAAATALVAGAAGTADYATTAGSAFAQSLLDDTTAAAARETLGTNNLPVTATTGLTLTIAHKGGLVSATGAVTVPSGVFAAGDVVSIYNNSASSISIVQGASLILRQAGTANTNTRTLLQRGIATVTFISGTEAVISGGGLS